MDGVCLPILCIPFINGIALMHTREVVWGVGIYLPSAVRNIQLPGAVQAGQLSSTAWSWMGHSIRIKPLPPCTSYLEHKADDGLRDVCQLGVYV